MKIEYGIWIWVNKMPEYHPFKQYRKKQFNHFCPIKQMFSAHCSYTFYCSSLQDWRNQINAFFFTYNAIELTKQLRRKKKKSLQSRILRYDHSSVIFEFPRNCRNFLYPFICVIGFCCFGSVLFSTLCAIKINRPTEIAASPSITAKKILITSNLTQTHLYSLIVRRCYMLTTIAMRAAHKFMQQPNEAFRVRD